MNTTIDTLTDDEVSQISQLIETLDRSTLDFLQIDSGSFKVTISKGGAAPLSSPPPSAPAAQPAAVSAAAAAPAAVQVAAAAPAKSPVARAAQEEGTLAILAPIMGRFYSRPEPGAPPFVTVGAEVEEDTPVGLIEVMKLFNTVQAGLRGTILEVCVEDGVFIEFGTPIFLVRPSGGTAS